MLALCLSGSAYVGVPTWKCLRGSAYVGVSQVISVLALSSWLFARDAQQLVIDPLEKMSNLVERLVSRISYSPDGPTPHRRKPGRTHATNRRRDCVTVDCHILFHAGGRPHVLRCA